MLTADTAGITAIQLMPHEDASFMDHTVDIFCRTSIATRDTQASLFALLTTLTQTLFIYCGYGFQAVVQDRQCSHLHHPHFPVQREHCRYACFRDQAGNKLQ